MDLEIRLTHQEATLQELNDVIVQHQKLIDRLSLEIAALKEQLLAQAQPNIASPAEETRPPHY